MGTPVDFLDSYNTTFRELINEKNWSSKLSIKETLKLSKESDWNFLCTAMDIICDSSMAISNFIKYGVDGPTKYNDKGESYLRLYGLLSATYLQQNAVMNIYRILSIRGFKEFKDNIKKLKIREIRNKLASHSNDFQTNFGKECYLPLRMTLYGHTCEYINNKTNELDKVDLIAEIYNSANLLMDAFESLLEASIERLYKTNKSREKWKEALNELRLKRKGAIIITGPNLKIVMNLMEPEHSSTNQE